MLPGRRLRAKMNKKVKGQILAIRDTGLTNMFDTKMVQFLANERGYYELVILLERTQERICPVHYVRGGIVMWRTGAMLIHGKVYKFQVKIYKVGSKYGIDGGKISKLWISCEDMVVASYERRWDVKPASEDAKLAVAILNSQF